MQQVDAAFSKSRRSGYKENVKTWGQLGLTGDWASRPVSLFGRNSASGTYGFFKEHVLKNGDYKDEVKEQPGSASVVQGVTVDRYAMGYSGIGYATAGRPGAAARGQAGRQVPPGDPRGGLLRDLPARPLPLRLREPRPRQAARPARRRVPQARPLAGTARRSSSRTATSRCRRRSSRKSSPSSSSRERGAVSSTLESASAGGPAAPPARRAAAAGQRAAGSSPTGSPPASSRSRASSSSPRSWPSSSSSWRWSGRSSGPPRPPPSRPARCRPGRSLWRWPSTSTGRRPSSRRRAASSSSRWRAARRPSRSCPSLGEATVVKAVAPEPELIVLGLSDGRLYPVAVSTEVAYDEGKRRVTPVRPARDSGDGRPGREARRGLQVRPRPRRTDRPRRDRARES